MGELTALAIFGGLVAFLVTLFYYIEFDAFWWAPDQRAARKAKRRRATLIAMHIASGMDENDACACADRQILQESDQSRKAWEAANG